MESILATQITIIASVSYLGYNILQLGRAYRWMLERVESYREFLQQEGLDRAHLQRLHRGVLAFLSIGYLGLLYLAGFHFWVLGVFALKFFLGGWLSDSLQSRILAGRPYRRSHHILVKTDAGMNLALVTLVLASPFL